MVKFFLEILQNIFITGVVNIFPTAILLLLIPDDILDRLQNLVLRVTKKKIDVQLIVFVIPLPFVIYFLSLPLEN
tara:strand:- start:331 stop:555 length:225 start_codon:yes stop_codon:yes gene_type:complete